MILKAKRCPYCGYFPVLHKNKIKPGQEEYFLECRNTNKECEIMPKTDIFYYIEKTIQNWNSNNL